MKHQDHVVEIDNLNYVECLLCGTNVSDVNLEAHNAYMHKDASKYELKLLKVKCQICDDVFHPDKRDEHFAEKHNT